MFGLLAETAKERVVWGYFTLYRSVSTSSWHLTAKSYHIHMHAPPAPQTHTQQAVLTCDHHQLGPDSNKWLELYPLQIPESPCSAVKKFPRRTSFLLVHLLKTWTYGWKIKQIESFMCHNVHLIHAHYIIHFMLAPPQVSRNSKLNLSACLTYIWILTFIAQCLFMHVKTLLKELNFLNDINFNISMT